MAEDNYTNQDQGTLGSLDSQGPLADPQNSSKLDVLVADYLKEYKITDNDDPNNPGLFNFTYNYSFQIQDSQGPAANGTSETTGFREYSLMQRSDGSFGGHDGSTVLEILREYADPEGDVYLNPSNFLSEQQKPPRLRIEQIKERDIPSLIINTHKDLNRKIIPTNLTKVEPIHPGDETLKQRVYSELGITGAMADPRFAGVDETGFPIFDKGRDYTGLIQNEKAQLRRELDHTGPLSHEGTAQNDPRYLGASVVDPTAAARLRESIEDGIGPDDVTVVAPDTGLSPAAKRILTKTIADLTNAKPYECLPCALDGLPSNTELVPDFPDSGSTMIDAYAAMVQSGALGTGGIRVQGAEYSGFASGDSSLEILTDKKINNFNYFDLKPFKKD